MSLERSAARQTLFHYQDSEMDGAFEKLGQE